MRLAIKHTDVIGTRDRHGNRFLVQPADPYIGRDLFVDGGFDEHNIRSALNILEQRDQTPDFLVDVGANIGPTTITVLAMLPQARAIAIEPDPRNFWLLQQNIVGNDLASRVALRNAAAAAEPTSLVLELSPDNPGDHRIRTAEEQGERHAIQVVGEPLDAIEDIPVGSKTLLWIDVQGFEAHVLAGASRLMRSGCPIVIEFWPAALRRTGTLAEILVQIADRTIFDLTISGPVLVDNLEGIVAHLDKTESHTDLLLV
jgi:FkbM family methyltransferase